MVQCPDCNGSGHIYYDEEGDLIAAEEFKLYAPGRAIEETCDYCEGTGEIEYDNEPDYDNYDE